MLRINDIENRLLESEQGVFQKVCNEILSYKGFKLYKHTGSVKGSNKTKKGTPDSVYIDNNNKYVYVEITTQSSNLDTKVKKDVYKCLEKIEKNPILNGKISKIIYLHNNENIDEIITEEIKQLCGMIQFEIYGIDYISTILQTECKDIAIELLNVKDDHQVINTISQESINQLASIITQNNVPYFKDNTIEEIKKKINNLYEEASLIVNNNDALVYISSENKEKLKIIFDILKGFDFYYKDKNCEDAQLYYHNMLVILAKYDSTKAIDFYNLMPEFAKKNNISVHFYSMILIENEKLEDAKLLLEDLYFNREYNDSFETLIRVYFLLGDYDNVIKLLTGVKVDKFDRYGFLASMFIISKNKKKKYTESEIIKLNNSKFKKMPLFYSCTAKLLFDLDKRKKKYKEQFQKGLNLLKVDDVIAIELISNQSIELGLIKETISFLESIKLSPVLQNKLLELLTFENVLTKKQIEFIESSDLTSLDTEIDKNYLLAKVAESKGKLLEAIKLYKKSYDEKSNISSAFKYIQLAIKNKTKIDEILINKIANLNNINALMISSEAYCYVGKYHEAIYCSYKAIYNSRSKPKYHDAFRQFWNILSLYGDKDENSNEFITKDCVVILKKDSEQHMFLLEDDDYFIDNDVFCNTTIIRTYSDIGLSLFHLKRDDEVIINDCNYYIFDIVDKYTYFAQYAFKYVKDNKSVTCITSSSENSDDYIEQIKQFMIKKKDDSNRRLDIYQDSKKIPLSGLLSNDNNFDEYSKLINTLLLDSNRIILTGENIDLDLSKGFVIDISTLILLSLFDILDLIPEDFCKNIYITISMKNKFQHFYESLIRKQESTESYLYVMDDSQLALNEMPVIDQIKFWSKLNKYINNFTIEDVEAEKDELLNDKTIGFLDKVQFDLIMLAKEKNLPFICDDLIIRKISNHYNVKHTNSLQIVKFFSHNYDEYISILIKYSKSNYIYTLYPTTLSELLKFLYENFTEHNKELFLSVITSILENKISFEYYAPILLNRLNNIKSAQYFQIFDQIYENLLATFFITNVSQKVMFFCEKFNINIDTLK